MDIRMPLATFLSILFALPGLSLASTAPDRYLGDASIYADTGAYTSTGEKIGVRANVLFIVDNSAAMRQTGGVAPYQAYEIDDAGNETSVPNLYMGNYDSWAIYNQIVETGGVINYSKLSKIPVLRTSNDAAINPKIEAVMCEEAVKSFEKSGVFFGKLNRNTGECTTNQRDEGKYYLGNLINYLTSPPDPEIIDKWQQDKSYNVGDRVSVSIEVTQGDTKTTYDVIYEVAGILLDKDDTSCKVNPDIKITQGTSGSDPLSKTDKLCSGIPEAVRDNDLLWLPVGSIMDTVKNVLQMVMQQARNDAKMGLMSFGDNNQGGAIRAPIRGISKEVEIDKDGVANFNDLIGKVKSLTFLPSNHKPVNETLWDAGLYFQGKNNSSDKIASEKKDYPSPVDNDCERNYIILLTTGSDNDVSQMKTKLPIDLTGDNNIGYVDDAASYIGKFDLVPSYEGTQGIVTHVIQLMTSEVPRLKHTAETWGGWDENQKSYRGKYLLAQNSAELTKGLLEFIGGLVAEVDTSFVAPVVPASTTNRTISGNRVYLGLFKPQNDGPWLGNLKKYQVGNDNRLKDYFGMDATYSEEEAEEVGNDSIKAGDFKPNSISYWRTSTSGDGGDVLAGGVGELLRSNGNRNVYTYLAATEDPNLNQKDNMFSPGNGFLKPEQFGVTTEEEKNMIIDWVLGKDVDDIDGDSNTTEARPWIMGDVLHSKPLVLSYAPYVLTVEKESDCNVNRSYIYVGSNGGMLHAFRDCDGSEAWSYIPDNVLGHLKDLRDSSAHVSFVDAPLSAYVHDRNNNGVIETSGGDRVLLIFGQHRGGSSSILGGPRGAYYLLDVTDPESPKFVKKVDESSWSEIGQTWGQPRLGKIKYSVKDNEGKEVDKIKIVAFLGAGYDSNEDLRYGNTQGFPDTNDATDISGADDGGGPRTSGQGTTSRANPKGRGVFAIEIAELDKKEDGKYDAIINNAGEIVWNYGPIKFLDEEFGFSIPSDITALDVNSDGFIDRLYVGDTGGRMWRFDIGSNNKDEWHGYVVFRSNPGADGTEGRKIFYRPAVTFDKGYPVLYFGTGDREHPLNRNVVDRLYMVVDRDQGANNDSINEVGLEDVTLNMLQEIDDSEETGNDQIEIILDRLTSKYGWYIKLNESNRDGEKVLAGATLFNDVVYYTTYTPNIITAPDPCKPGNLGRAEVYQVDARTGEAVFNNDGSNDSSDANSRAAHESGYVLKRSDRRLRIGEGIPSGVVTLIDASGRVNMMISSSNRVNTINALDLRTITPVYWMQW